MNTGITWRSDESSHQATNFLRDEAFESQLSSLKEVALEMLNAVEALKSTTRNRDNRQLNLQDEVRRFETDLIHAALVRTRGNQVRAARLLGVKHTTLNAKIKRYRITLQTVTSEDAKREIAA